MGVDIPLDKFYFIDVLKELELSREQISKKNEHCLDIHDSNGNVAPLCLSWHDTVVEEEEKFTVVSRKKKKSPAKRNVTISSLTSSSIPCTRSQQKNISSTLPPSRSGRVKKNPDRYKNNESIILEL